MHRWLGVLALLYFAAMAVSGLFLNHPELLAGFSLPRSWIPGDYTYRNWNRNALRGAVLGPEGERYLFGEAGVWRQSPAGGDPTPLSSGYESSPYFRDTRALLRADLPGRSILLAGTRGGLYGLVLDEGASWTPLGLGNEVSRQPVVDLLVADEHLMAVTRSHVYRSEATWPPVFRDVTPRRESAGERQIPLFRLVFQLHSGETWGLPGRLVVDLGGLILLFLALTGGYFWWRRTRGTVARGWSAAWVRRGLRWHIRLGAWAAPLVLFVGLTGFLQRPPFLIAIASAQYPRSLHPAPVRSNPWHDLLRKASYDPVRRELLLATADGFFLGPASLDRPFRPVPGGPPVSVMGATVLERLTDGTLRVGSMSGLFDWDPDSGRVVDVFTGEPPSPGQRGPVGDHQVVGWLGDSETGACAVDYAAGVLDARGRAAALSMPKGLADHGRISLWHALFEFHNGRLFGFLLGWWAWLVVPLGGLALLVEVLSGAVLRPWGKRRRRAKA